MPTADQALPGRGAYAFAVPDVHYVNGHSIKPPFPAGTEVAYFALGCFWGAEKTFWNTPGVYTTAAGYQGGYTPFPTYAESVTGRTGHAETVMVAFDPTQVSYAQLLSIFFEHHNPTQGMRQGNDMGTEYRSAIYTTSATHLSAAQAAKAAFQERLTAAGFGVITTEIAPANMFYYAEGHHQQYLAKNPMGYCPDHGTGVACPVGLFQDQVPAQISIEPGQPV